MCRKKADKAVNYLLLMKIMIVIRKKVPANFVPAAAVKRGGLALFVMTGRKGSLDGLICLE